MVFPRGFAPRTSAFAGQRAWTLTPREQRWCGMPVLPRRSQGDSQAPPARPSGCLAAVCLAASTAARLEDKLARCYTNTACRNWPLEPELRRPLRFFKPLLICLSHPAMEDFRFMIVALRSVGLWLG
jgi:hypothetical protein